MPNENGVLHTTHRNKNRHLHLFLLFIPSVVFVLVIAFFMRNKYTPNTLETMAISSTPLPRIEVKVKDTAVTARLALTEADQQRGLSGVSALAENEGMLFVFGEKKHTTFWMKDMLIPLDMIWIADNKVVYVHENVPRPLPDMSLNELPRYYPNDPVDHVLEVNAGFVAAHMIKVGDEVTIPNF